MFPKDLMQGRLLKLKNFRAEQRARCITLL